MIELNCTTDVSHCQWRVARDCEQVHRLLCASDAFHAAPGAPVPQRNPQTTHRHVQSGAVHGLFAGSALVAMFTLTPMAPFGVEPTDFGPARRAMYLQRLAVDSHWATRDALLGVRCVKRAIELAGQAGVEVLRAELNSRLAAVVGLLLAMGFTPVGTERSDGDGVPRLNVQRELC